METSVLLQDIIVFDPASPWHLRQANLLWAEGKIARLTTEPLAQAGATVVQGRGALHVSAGWLDLRASIPEPGLEHKEDFASGAAAAQRGGFTQVAVLPNTQPPLQTKEAVAFVRSRSARGPVEFLPLAAASADLAGAEMADLLDLHHAGAVAFTDGHLPIYKTSLLLKTLLYLQPVGGLLMNLADEKSLSQYGQMHEGLASTHLGLPGVPALAEVMGLRRDLDLLAYAGGRLHVSCLSSAEGLQLVRQAKAQGLAVTADVATYHLAFTDEDLADFDTNLKTKPPLRSAQDQAAIRAALADGTVDVLVSNHLPQDEESKVLEFDLADYGLINLETSFALARTHAGLPLAGLLPKFTDNPRRILGLPQPVIAEGAVANLTLFHPDVAWTPTMKDFASKARNTPLPGRPLQGRALGGFHQYKYWLNSGWWQ
jgi:dihydroorotase